MAKKYKNIHEKLIKRCRRGDPKAQMELYTLYYKAMYNTSLRIVNDTMEAEDVMQEAFLAAFEKLATYRNEVSFGYWLKRIVINKSLDAIKKQKIQWASLDDPKSPQPQENQQDTEQVPEPGYTVEQVKQAIQQLKPGYRVVISLYLLEGYDHEEIGDILNISASSSRSQYTRAKKKLLELLTQPKT